MIDGWSYGSLSLRRVVKRVGVSGPQVVERAKALAIEVRYNTAELEVAALDKPSPVARAFDRASGEWIEIQEEED